MALGRERMRNSWYEWNLSNSWEDPWYDYGSGDSGGSLEDDWYTNEIRYYHWSPWTRREDDYRHRVREDGDRRPLRPSKDWTGRNHREDGNIIPLHAPLGAYIYIYIYICDDRRASALDPVDCRT